MQIMLTNNLIVSIFLLTFSVALRAVSQDVKPSKKIEKKIVSLIRNLPEMVNDNKYMTKKGRPFIIYVEDKPGDVDKYYHVAVSEYNGMNLVPHFRFLVNAKTFAIYYLDFWNDNFKPIPLKVWRTRKLKSN